MIAQRLERRKSNMAKDNFITRKREYKRAYKDAWVSWCCVWCGVWCWAKLWVLSPIYRGVCLGLDGSTRVVQVA